MSQKRRIGRDDRDGGSRPKKRFRKQREYHSSSEESDAGAEDFTPFDLGDSGDEGNAEGGVGVRNGGTGVADNAGDNTTDNPSESDEESGEEDGDGGKESSTITKRPTSKRNDPEVFSNSISKILSTKLSQSARKDPLLSRSKEASDLGHARANERLERKAKAKLRAEKRQELERGRVKDVLGLSTGQTGEVAEDEKRLRKIAQRGVIKLFNAVRAAQVRAEEAAREERKKRTVGMANREAKATEMSKQGFLDLINGKS